MSPDPIFHPHMSPYVGMDDNPVALCDPYGLATGNTPPVNRNRKGGRRAAEKRAKEVGGKVFKSKTKSGTYHVDYYDKEDNFALTSETYEETKVQKVLSWIGDKVESAYDWLGEKESTIKSIFRDKANRFAESKTGKGIKTVAHEGFLPVAKAVNNVSQMLLPTKSAMNLISGAATGKNLEGEEMTKGDYAWETLGVLPIGMADDAARGAKGLIDEVGELGAKTVKKEAPMLAQFSSKTIDEAVQLTMNIKGKHIFEGTLHPKPYLDKIANALGGRDKLVKTALEQGNGYFPSAGQFELPFNVNGIKMIMRGFVNNGKPIINTLFDPLMPIK